MSDDTYIPATREECLREMNEVAERCVTLEHQLAVMRRNGARGRYADSDDFNGKEKRLALLRIRRQMLQNTLGMLKSLEKRRNHERTSWEKRFVEAAQRRLTADLFDELIEEAKALADQAGR